MRQILQNLGSGETILADVPAPGVRPGHILIRTEATLVSLGTERMLVEFGRAGLVQKALQQPERVRQVIQKIKTDGLWSTVQAVRSKLDQPIPLGYCNAGRVVEVGVGVDGYAAGDRVVSNGPHAEVVCVPKHLCAKVPANVSTEAAAFTVAGAVALQGIRLLQPMLGETVAVTGLGLIGLLAAQILRAHGCRVLGVDIDPARCELARGFGVETIDLSKGVDPLAAARILTHGRGADAVLIAASTPSSEPVHQAAQMCRQRGRVVLVGVTGLELQRSDFYEKEITFQVSCSYGPGRYDPDYEERGRDYPFGLVRWTEQRNFEAVLQLMADGALRTEALVTHRYDIGNALEGYANLAGQGALGIIVRYPGTAEAPARRVPLPARAAAPKVPQVVVGLLGAGSFAGQVLLPALARTGVRLKTIVSGSGVTGTHWGRKFGFETSATDAETVFGDPEINTVFVATRHHQHAAQVCRALRAGKQVFVEKPLCLTMEEVREIAALMGEQFPVGQSGGADINQEPIANNPLAAVRPLLMVGFNRRFAPHVRKMKALLDTVPEPKAFVMTVNAGALPATHWAQDVEIGGGRIVGEACHFIDLLRFLAGAPIASARADFLDGESGRLHDTASLHLAFADGSIGTVHYFANGDRGFPKERLEAFCAGRVLQLDNFRVLRGHGWRGFGSFRTWGQQKGHREELEAFVAAVRSGGPPPIPWAEIAEVSQVVIKLAEGGMVIGQ
jgi:predicted dehydrogenase/threonine dehydrogenase-like Zn-dependent dehydrogenase